MGDSAIAVKGLSELLAALDQLPDRIEKNVMRQGLYHGALVFKEIAKEKAQSIEAPPSWTASHVYGAHEGSLAESLRISSRVVDGRFTTRVIAGGKVAYYAHMVEYGTVAHVIKARLGSSLSIGGKQYAEVAHPGAKKEPFMRPAFDQYQGAIDAMKAYMTERIPVEFGKQAQASAAALI